MASCSGACAKGCPTCPKVQKVPQPTFGKKGQYFFLHRVRDGFSFAFDFGPASFRFCFVYHTGEGTQITCSGLEFIRAWSSLEEKAKKTFWLYVKTHKSEFLQSIQKEVVETIQAYTQGKFKTEEREDKIVDDKLRGQMYQRKKLSEQTKQTLAEIRAGNFPWENKQDEHVPFDLFQ